MLVARVAWRNVLAAWRGAIRPLNEKAEVALNHRGEEDHQRRLGQRLHSPATWGVLDCDQGEGNFYPSNLVPCGRKHVTVEHQPVLIDLGLPTLLADHRDAMDIGPQRFWGVAQIEPGRATLD